MPRTKEQNEEIRARRREAIMKGALRVYAEKGYAAADIGEVAELAGVARGLVYYYYKDKLTVFRELFLYMFDLSNLHTRKHFSQDGTALELCEKFAFVMYENLFESSDHIRFFFRIRHDVQELFSTEELKSLKWRGNNMLIMVETLRRGMEMGQIRRMSPEILADQYWGAIMHGMMHLHQRNEVLRQEGKSLEEAKTIMQTDIRDAVLSCMAMLHPNLNQ